jgi:hypothetical protein
VPAASEEVALTDQQSNTAGTAPECQVCPLCMGIAALRQSRPEAVEHALKAGVELMAAVRALLEPPPGDGHRRTSGMQRIDIG